MAGMGEAGAILAMSSPRSVTYTLRTVPAGSIVRWLDEEASASSKRLKQILGREEVYLAAAGCAQSLTVYSVGPVRAKSSAYTIEGRCEVPETHPTHDERHRGAIVQFA